MIDKVNKQIAELTEVETGHLNRLDENRESYEFISARYQEMVSWTEMFDDAELDVKQMIISNMFKRVEIHTDYRIVIDFDGDIEGFTAGLNEISGSEYLLTIA